MSLGEVTICVPYYRNQLMLQVQLQKWQHYPSGVKIIVVDDCSPEPAASVIDAYASADLQSRIELYRIMVDIPWNREEARNLAARHCKTEWIVMIDIDHVLPWNEAHDLLNFTPHDKHWYRFPRFRVGKADETRKKDALRPDEEFGSIHPHVDSYLIRKDLYWRVGGYDLAFSGCLGGGSDFLKRLESVAEPRLLPANIALHVYTRSEVKDASDWSLSRDTTEGKRRARAKQAKGNKLKSKPVVSPWERQL